MIYREEALSARSVLASLVDDCVLLPLGSAELLLAVHRRLALRGPQAGALAPEAIIGVEGGLAKAWAVAQKAAGFDADVLITGESGTGKELFAGAIHRLSKRAHGPFIALNCAAIPTGLVESQLFGHLRGAFTDAHSDRMGVFARASGGTLFLDEIGDLSAEIQVKLLRVLQTRQVQALGASESVPVDVRVISATSLDLQGLIKKKGFRDDLYYRLAVVPVALPALRERRQDLSALLDHFLQRFAAKHGLASVLLAPEARQQLLAYSWPGNVRELENAVERLLVLADEQGISMELVERELGISTYLSEEMGASSADVHTTSSPLGLQGRPLREAMHRAEALFIAEALQACAGKRSKCAELLSISQRALLYKIKEHNL